MSPAATTLVMSRLRCDVVTSPPGVCSASSLGCLTGTRSSISSQPAFAQTSLSGSIAGYRIAPP